MKLATYATDAGPRVGVLDGEDIIPIPGIPDMLAFLQHPELNHTIEAALKGRIDVQSASDVTFLAPIPRPPKIVCMGVNYYSHAQETGRTPPEAPILFSKPPTAVIGPEAKIILPKESNQVDYEVELALVIGKSGRFIPEDQALEHVGGYTVFNDISARDFQYRDGQWFRGKSFDTFAPMGPCLTSPDQISNPEKLALQLRINGDLRQKNTTGDMIFSIPQIISNISSVMTLEPGDIIATGTPAGVGLHSKPNPRFLQPGDVIEAEIQGIGILRNSVTTNLEESGSG